MSSKLFRWVRDIGAVALIAWLVAGCGSTSSGDKGGGNVFSNLLLYGGTTVPPEAKVPTIEVMDCPPVTVADGGAAIRAVAGSADASAVRSQLSIAEVARECTGRDDGAVIVKVGIQVRALLGPGGGSARFDTPVSIVLKRGDQTLLTRTRRLAIAVPPGQPDQTAVVVEDNMVVPPGTGEFEIEVALGSGARAPAAFRARRGRG